MNQRISLQPAAPRPNVVDLGAAEVEIRFCPFMSHQVAVPTEVPAGMGIVQRPGQVAVAIQLPTTPCMRERCAVAVVIEGKFVGCGAAPALDLDRILTQIAGIRTEMVTPAPAATVGRLSESLCEVMTNLRHLTENNQLLVASINRLVEAMLKRISG